MTSSTQSDLGDQENDKSAISLVPNVERLCTSATMEFTTACNNRLLLVLGTDNLLSRVCIIFVQNHVMFNIFIEKFLDWIIQVF